MSSPFGPYLDVEWTDGEIMTEGKLDQMQDNLDVLREALGVQNFGSCPFVYRSHDHSGTGATEPSYRLKMTINAVTTQTDRLTGGMQDILDFKNIDVTALSNGTTYTATLICLTKPDIGDDPTIINFDVWPHLGTTAYKSGDLLKFRFRKQQEISFVSLFLKAGIVKEFLVPPFGADNHLFVYIVGANFFGHSVSQGW